MFELQNTVTSLDPSQQRQPNLLLLTFACVLRSALTQFFFRVPTRLRLNQLLHVAPKRISAETQGVVHLRLQWLSVAPRDDTTI